MCTRREGVRLQGLEKVASAQSHVECLQRLGLVCNRFGSTNGQASAEASMYHIPCFLSGSLYLMCSERVLFL
jgi:hypothetical protein